jgi:hypothetical protein
MGDGKSAKRGLESPGRACDGFSGAGRMFLKIDGCRKFRPAPTVSIG